MRRGESERAREIGCGGGTGCGEREREGARETGATSSLSSHSWSCELKQQFRMQPTVPPRRTVESLCIVNGNSRWNTQPSPARRKICCLPAQAVRPGWAASARDGGRVDARERERERERERDSEKQKERNGKQKRERGKESRGKSKRAWDNGEFFWCFFFHCWIGFVLNGKVLLNHPRLSTATAEESESGGATSPV